jgi:hypothetical protein
MLISVAKELLPITARERDATPAKSCIQELQNLRGHKAQLIKALLSNPKEDRKQNQLEDINDRTRQIIKDLVMVILPLREKIVSYISLSSRLLLINTKDLPWP